MIDPNAITTKRVGQLPSEVWSGTDNLPHEVGTDLKRGTVADLATYIAGIIDASAGLAFNPLKISDGQTLPETTESEWIIVGQGTYLQTGGFPNVVCTDDINIVISDGASWSLGFGIAVDGVDTSQFVKLTTNQTIDGVKTFVQPITLPNDSTVQEGNIGGISLVCSIAKELNWKEGVLRSYNQSDANSKANPIIGESPITYVGQEFKDLINFSTADPITDVISIEFEGDLRAMNTAFHYENTNYRLYLYDLDNNILGIGKYDSVTYNDVDLSVLDIYDVENIKSGSTINSVVRVVGREIDINTLATIEEINRIAIPYTGTTQPIMGFLEFEISGVSGSLGYNAYNDQISLFNANKAQSVDSNGFYFNDVGKYINAAPDIGFIGSIEFDNDGSDRRVYAQTGWVQDAIADSIDGVELQSNKGEPNGYAPLNASATIDLEYFPDAILGQLIHGGMVNCTTMVATLTNNAKTKLGTASATITLTNDTTAITGYVANEGIYYIATTDGTFAGISFLVGDWLISTGSSWQKVDNTDAVASVNGQTGVVNISLQDVLDVSNESATGIQISENLNPGIIGNSVLGVGLVGYSEENKASVFDIGSSNTNNITEFQKGSTTQASISHDGVLSANGAILTGAITATNLSGTNTGDENENNVSITHDFFSINSSEDYLITNLNSGTVTTGTPTANNQGVIRISSSTSTNSGVVIKGSGLLVRVKGGEVFTYIFNPLLFTNTTSRLGIHDTSSNADANNGIYFEYSGSGILTFKTADNGTRTTSASLGTLSTSTWYKVRFTVNSNATSVLAQLFDATGTLISSITQTTNIPTSARAVSVNAITTNSGTSAQALIDVDYINTKFSLTR